MTATAPLPAAPNRYDLLSDTHMEFEGDTAYVWPEDRASARLILAGDIGSIGGGTWLRFLQTPEVSEFTTGNGHCHAPPLPQSPCTQTV